MKNEAMHIENGNSLRLFYLQQELDATATVDAFARYAAPSIGSLGNDPISGWVTGRYLFDRELTADNCVFGSYVYAVLMKAERRIPSSLLRTHCRMEEDIECRARDVGVLPRAVRAEIKQRVRESLLPSMPPTLNSIPAVVDLRNGLLVSGAITDKQVDALSPAFKEAVGTYPIALTPETAALRRKQINANDLDPVNFSPDQSVVNGSAQTLGMDFLTWLWFAWEKDGGLGALPDGRTFGVMLEGPLVLYHEGQGAFEVVIRKGTPINSREASTALHCGKKLRRAKLVVGIGDDIMSATLDSDFVFRSIRIPKGEQIDAAGQFVERMFFLETFWSVCLTLFDRFLNLRSDPIQWDRTLTEMKQWIYQH